MRGIRLTNAQRCKLLSVYAEFGFRGARHYAIAYGVSPRYLARLAARRGVKPVHAKRVSYSRGDNDKRWQRAIDRGSVVA